MVNQEQRALVALANITRQSKILSTIVSAISKSSAQNQPAVLEMTSENGRKIWVAIVPQTAEVTEVRAKRKYRRRKVEAKTAKKATRH